MTEGFQPTAGHASEPDSDTAAFPRVGPQKPPVWTPDQKSSKSEDSPGGFGPISGIGAKLSAAGAAAVSAASSAKGAMKGAADAAEARSSGPARGPSPSASRPTTWARSTSRQPRKARLTLSHINVYSVFKFSCVLAIALFFVWLIMVGVLYGVLDVAGAVNQVNKAVRTISGVTNAKDVVTGSLVFGSAIIIGAVNIVLFIAMSTIGAIVYNLCADLVGGAEITLSERE